MTHSALLGFSCLLFLGSAFGQNLVPGSIENYNRQLPHWGISWKSGADSVNGYYPSFYTGFAMRSQFPERIHVRTARGNQTRVSVILDQTTISDYLFDLQKRYDFYREMTVGPLKSLNLAPAGAQFLPQLQLFNQIIESDLYQILKTVELAKSQQLSEIQLYEQSLTVLTALNPGRVFKIKLSLNQEFLKWRSDVLRRSSGNPEKILNDPKSVVAALNSLVWGRINLVSQPSTEILSVLKKTLELTQSQADEAEFLESALRLFKLVTGSKYQFRVLSELGQWQNAIQCQNGVCFLTYPEFTAIYPTGSLEAKTSDEFGNVINQFATPGLWQFLNYSGRDVDNIRNEPFYGFVPKMDFENIGNGFHNPAVRFFDPPRALKAALGIPLAHDTLWAVKRGGVSHGCLRTPTGHVWEMRQIFPVENDKMTQIYFFGNNSQDFDLYDIDGDGSPEIMGVSYLISYGLQGSEGLARREGTDFQLNAGKKLEFYEELYGKSKVFHVENPEKFVFINPPVSVHSHLDFQKKSVSTRVIFKGDYPLFEQNYEKEKVQLYSLGSSISDRQKLLIRLMGRVRGCAPQTNKNECGQTSFEQEARKLLGR